MREPTYPLAPLTAHSPRWRGSAGAGCGLAIRPAGGVGGRGSDQHASRVNDPKLGFGIMARLRSWLSASRRRARMATIVEDRVTLSLAVVFVIGAAF
jgi:hypothetical protein